MSWVSIGSCSTWARTLLTTTRDQPVHYAHVLRIPMSSEIINTLHSRQPTLWLHDLNLKVLTVQLHGNELRMFGPRHSPYAHYQCRAYDIAAVGTTFAVFRYELPDAERTRYVLWKIVKLTNFRSRFERENSLQASHTLSNIILLPKEK